MEDIDNKKLDIEVNSTCAKNEYIIEPLTEDSVCTKSHLSSIPIEKDAEVTEHMKTTGSSLTVGKANQFIAQGTTQGVTKGITKGITKGKQKYYTLSVGSGATSVEIQVTGIHNNYICLTIFTPTGANIGKRCRTGTITCNIKPKNGGYVQKGEWKLAVSGDDDYKIKKAKVYYS